MFRGRGVVSLGHTYSYPWTGVTPTVSLTSMVLHPFLAFRQRCGGANLAEGPTQAMDDNQDGPQAQRWRRLGNCLCNASTVTCTPTVLWTR